MALSTNLVSYYKFDSSNSNDSVGSNNGTDTTISYVAGLIGNGASYTANSSRISLGDPANLKFSGAHTLNIWINMGGTNRANLDQLFSKGNDGTDFSCITLYWSNSNTLVYGINANRTTNTRVEISNTVTVDSNWHMVTAVYTGTNMYLYWDGTQIATTSTSITIDTTDNWYIGNTNSTRSVNKKLDEAGMWSRALSGSEITQLYNSGNGNQYPFGNAYTITAAVGAFVLTGISALFTKAMRMAVTVGDFTLTGINAIFRLGKGIVAGVGQFILTGNPANLIGPFRTVWTDISKPNTSWTDGNKPSTTWTDITKGQ